MSTTTNLRVLAAARRRRVSQHSLPPAADHAQATVLELPTPDVRRATLLRRIEATLEAMESARGACAILCVDEEMRLHDLREIAGHMEVISLCVRELAAL